MLWMMLAVAHADVASTTTTDSGMECMTEGDACTTADGADGTCDADMTCVADEESGCSTTGSAGAGSAVALAIGLLALRPRRR